MKVAVILCACVFAVASAEPPKYAAPAPYPPSGWRPSGPQFSLPSRAAPQTEYKAPPKEKYGPPPAVYGPPTTTEAPTTTDLPTTTEENTTEVSTDNPQDNEFSGDGSRASTAQAPATRGNGVYYVLLPDGRLQRVAYSTSRDSLELQRLIANPQPVNAGFFAVQYEDVQPIQAPVYAYGSPLVRLFK